MQDSLMINNMYAAYSATSSHVNSKSVSQLSQMMKSGEKDESTAPDVEMSMDKLIISNEALAMLKQQQLV
ncbi:MAG: hypothetical protein LBV09_02095 [Deferribacteraceae bacterium]|nr:hypothetical protein [Deferribacteraceae bacterium]